MSDHLSTQFWWQFLVKDPLMTYDGNNISIMAEG
jgi:hypothetical protein